MNTASRHYCYILGDRRRFFALLEQQMLKSGLENIGISCKEARKHNSIA